MLKFLFFSHLLTEPGSEASIRSETPELARVYQDNIQYVWRSLRHLGVHPSDLEDVCHDVFLVVGRKLAGFEQRSTLRTWLYGICVRSVSDYRQRAFRRREILHDAMPDSIRPPDQEESARRRRLRAQLAELLDGLSDEQREVFVLYEVEELTMKEVADVLGCPLQTAYSRLHAARRLLRERLAAAGVVP